MPSGSTVASSAYNPVGYSTDGRPDLADCCIFRELGRYSTRKAEQLLPPTVSFSAPCCLFMPRAGPSEEERTCPSTGTGNGSVLVSNTLPRFGFGSCDRCHKLGSENPIIFWRPSNRVQCYPGLMGGGFGVSGKQIFGARIAE